MKALKKIFSIGISAVLAAGILSGCGGNGESGETAQHKRRRQTQYHHNFFHNNPPLKIDKLLFTQQFTAE